MHFYGTSGAVQRKSMLNIQNISIRENRKISVTYSNIIIFITNTIALLFAILCYAIDQNKQIPQYSLLLCGIVILVCNSIYALKKISRNYLFFFLQITTFTFMYGQSIFCFINGDFSTFELTPSELDFANLLLVINLYGLFVGELLRKNKVKSNSQVYSISSTNRVRRISKCVFICGYVIIIYSLLDKISFVSTYSYIDSYISYKSPLSLIASRLSSVVVFSFYLFLGTLPTKKECKLPIALYLLYSVLSLGTQSRNQFVLGVVIIILYLTLRQRMNNTEKWFSKKMIMASVIAVPFIVIYLATIEYVRMGNQYTFSIIGLLEDFFKSQGGSVRVIGLTQRYEQQLDTMSNTFLFGPAIWQVKYNAVFKYLFGIVEPAIGTAEMARYGGIFSHSLTYIYSSLAYSNGYGIGSCYIAEAYIQWEYIGVVIISVFVGYFISYINSSLSYQGRPIRYACLLFMAEKLIYLPRDCFVNFFVSCFSVSNVLFMIVIAVAAKRGIKNA